MSVKSTFFQYSKDVYTENISRLEMIKAIAADCKFEIAEFGSAKYSADEFKTFVEGVESKVGRIPAVILAFSIAAGVRRWHEVLAALDTFELIKNACQAALLKPENRNMSKADIVFRELEQLNGRLAIWEKYDIANRFLHGLFSRTRRWKEVVNSKGEIIREERRLLADCVPLTMLFYLTMSVLGEDTKLYLTWTKNDKGEIGSHCFSVIGEKPQENTTKDGIPGKLHENKFYNREVDFWAILADSMGLQQNNLLGNNNVSEEDIKNGIAQLKAALEYDPYNPYLYEVIAKANRELGIRMNDQGLSKDAIGYFETALTYFRIAQKFYENSSYKFPEAVRKSMENIIASVLEALRRLNNLKK
jgi:hypothetical protein